MKIGKMIKKVKKEFGIDVSVRITSQSIILDGEGDKWDDIVHIGYMFVDPKRKLHVVNDIRLKNFTPPAIHRPQSCDDSLDGVHPDVLVIGGGIIGCSILRELSRRNLDLLLIEKEADVACGASGANDGMVHPGIDLKPGLRKTGYCLKGNVLYDEIAKELGIDFIRCGQYIIFSNTLEKRLSAFIVRKGRRMGIPGIHMLSKKALLEKEPHVGSWAKGAVALDSTGIISPYKTTIAYAENAIQNKAKIALETVCLGMEVNGGGIIGVHTNRGTIYPRLVINAAGVFSDEIARMADDRFFSIHPRKGTDIIFDNKTKKYVRSIVARCPLFTASKTHTKGGAIVSTVDGNVLFGPNAIETPDREDKATGRSDIDQVYEKYQDVISTFKKSDIIAYFTGIRPSTYEEDFIIEASEKVRNLIHVAGIQSPGLTAAPAIAKDVARLAVNKLSEAGEVRINPDFNPYRKPIPHVASLPMQVRDDLIRKNPDYGRIICRCEEVSLGEIKDAILSPLGAHNIDAVKRRVRPGMGRCQGGFCMPLILKILSEELKTDLTDIKKRGEMTNIGCYHTKDIQFDEGGKLHDKL